MSVPTSLALALDVFHMLDFVGCESLSTISFSTSVFSRAERLADFNRSVLHLSSSSVRTAELHLDLSGLGSRHP